MMHRLLAAAVMLIAASAAAAPGPAPAAAAERVDVCIVGAGPAGVAAAVTLARRNKTIAVLERRDGVGGQAWANWTDPATGVRLLLGAVIIASQEDTTVLGFAKELGIGTQRFDFPIVGIVAGKTTISTARLGRALPDAVPGLRSALANYTAARSALLPAFNADGGVAATLRAAPQLAGNMDAWMRDNGATPLIPFAAQILLETGYGHLYESPAALLLNVLPSSFIISWLVALGVPSDVIVPPAERNNPFYNGVYNVFTDDIGYAEFLRRLAELLPDGALRLGVNITSVARPAADADAQSAPDVLVSYADASSPQHLLRCGALINTAAPTASGSAYLDLDAEECALFASVFANRYYTTALRIEPGLRTGQYGVLPPADAGLFLRQAAAPTAAVDNGTHLDRPALPVLASLVDRYPYRGDVVLLATASPGAANRPPGVAAAAAPTLAVAYSLSDAATTRAAVARNATRAVSGSTRRGTAEAVLAWDMNPRMQGRRRTYHAGGTFTAWTVDKAMRISGVEVAQRYFA